MDQHFIVNEKVFDKMIEFAEISDKDTVLEIGGGPGFLTSKLAKKAKKVVVVELDKRFFPTLKRVAKNVVLIEGDALKVRLPPFKKIVANLPFSISGPFISRIMAKRWSVAVLVLQKEFAEKLTKKGCPESTALSFLANYCMNVQIVDQIPISNFYPAPNVDTVITKLVKKKDTKRLPKVVERVCRALYQHKRKKSWNALLDSSKELKISEEELKKVFRKRPKYLEKRVYDLSIGDFERLSEKLESIRK